MRRLAVPVLALGVLATRVVAADEGGYDDLGTRPTSVEATLAGTNVRMTARFAIEVEGPGVALNVESIAIPARAVVTSGSLVVDGKRHRMRLQPAAVADRAFNALTLKPGRAGDRAWAALISGSPELVSIDVLAPRAAKVTVELTLDAPTCFFDDARFVELPAAWWQRVPAAQRNAVRSNDGAVAAACTQDDGDDSHWLGFASRHLVKQRAGDKRIGTIASRLPLSAKHLARVELDVSRELGDIPADLHTAIVIDHSRSMTVDELEAQRAIVAAYLRLAPTSRVQVIGYARRATPLLAGWMLASHAAPRIDREIRALAPRNGSNLDDALIAAAAWLSRVEGTRRLVVFSDERLAERLTERLGGGTPETVRALPPSTLVHVVKPEAGFALVRNDEGLLAGLAATTQGIEVTGGADDDGHVDALQLLRPISLDRIAIGSHGWQDLALFDDRACADSLREGRTCTWWGEGDAASGPVVITGRLWNTPFKRVVRADPAHARAIARVLSGGQLDDLQPEIDRLALAINSAWSLFAQWSGSGGYEDVGGFGTIGGGRFSTSSRDHAIGTVRPRPGRAPLDLRAQVQPALTACNAGDAPITVAIETTREEIVDVDVVAGDPALRDCVAEAVWDLTLRIVDAPGHATTRVAFGNKR